MHRWYLATGFALMISGCSNTPTIVVQNIWPNLPDVPAIPNIDLKPIQFSLPNKSSFIALDYANWLNYQTNQQIYAAREQLYKSRIDEINLQRQEWRKLNEVHDASSNKTR